MVDFQERDESRGFGSGGEDELDEGGSEADVPTDSGDSEGATEDETADDPERGDEQEEHDHGQEHGHAEPGQYEGDHGHDEHGHDHDHRDDEHGHDHHRHDVEQVGAAVVTISTSRSLDSDPAGDAIESGIEATGEVVTRELIPDDFDTIQGTVNRLADREDVDVIVTAGGTGVTPDDVTIEAVSPLFSKELPGFGELFRILSHEDIGTKVVATRATAGIVEGVPVFCMPGSESAVRLGTEEIIVPEAGHLAGLAARGNEEDEE